ncbi:beta-lactamase-like protein [Clohesyomyces aquaticus]|uniref:Beta-lactamase-like protein n=1 Tax=Clohesyomyces aquaticus TaxID=1231657 RepID=A0A1Y2A399_9PLEO|nr:beta-lactamase-like protein [Clohesyomyces aquaticus]
MEVQPSSESPKPPSTCFTCQRLNGSTFVIVEDDKWHETPFIYAKVYDSVIVLVDTGCGGASKDPDVQLKSLRQFIETYPIPANENKPINSAGALDYVVICTHCHFDHIGGVEQFSESAIWASACDRDFTEDENLLPSNSLCRFMGMETPRYKVTTWAADGERVKYGPDGLDLNLTVYQTPGHAPDQLAIWDSGERVLFVGDTAYEWVPIVFPLEGSIPLYKETLLNLIKLVHDLNVDSRESDATPSKLSSITAPASARTHAKRVTMASGHGTSNVDAENCLKDVYDFLCQVQKGDIEPRDWGSFRGEELVCFETDGKISFGGPKKMFLEFIREARMGAS